MELDAEYITPTLASWLQSLLTGHISAALSICRIRTRRHFAWWLSGRRHAIGADLLTASLITVESHLVTCTCMLVRSIHPFVIELKARNCNYAALLTLKIFAQSFTIILVTDHLPVISILPWIEGHTLWVFVIRTFFTFCPKISELATPDILSILLTFNFVYDISLWS